MPFIGAKVKTQDHFIATSAYKEDTENFNFEDLRSYLEMTVKIRSEGGIVDLANGIATAMEPKMFLDYKVPFYWVEVTSVKGHSYTTHRHDEENM